VSLRTRFAWPRAETRIYQEPKNLVEHGLATAHTETNGRRTRTVYTITLQGRRALQRWLELPSAPPAMESESLVRAAFAEHGSKEALVRTLRGLQQHGRTMHRDALNIVAEYADSRGPFPERLHLNVLVGKFILDYTALLERWASWAEQEVERWETTGPAHAVPVPWDVVRAGVEEQSGPPA
jgi:DNA-binding PadR family transcriptional regulator